MFHAPSHRSARRVAAPLAGLLAAAALATGTPAHAAALSANPDCESSGAGRFFCIATVSGGTAPYSYTWTTVANAAIINGAHHGVVVGACTPPYGSLIDLTATDSAGASVTVETGFDCTATPA